MDLLYDEAKTEDKYRWPESHSSVTIVCPGPSCRARCKAPTTFMPEEPPTKSPSSRSSLCAISTASSSLTRNAWSTSALEKFAVSRSHPTPSKKCHICAAALNALAADHNTAHHAPPCAEAAILADLPTQLAR
eukprot:CAMPEP_0119327938 /NCGR_PEP_ID=MMETSP1333-20130426/72014_1 /TAXON_ID=418940 /ORGANISM="Scyphosphaera apsteinii, Strain RCC1455" /LENGTH=132 /DNA_ID=CAMNT_0007336663 /DNA_START=248 /DNA_END=643 /DNA_ORIENTATION=-